MASLSMSVSGAMAWSWFASRRFFDQRQDATQSLWMDMALARRSGQELRNSYIITNSPEYAPLRRFFKARNVGSAKVADYSDAGGGG